MKGKTALVAEGGGLRGVFPAGVLDAFLAADFNPFDLYIGVSSGVLTLGSYLARQAGRTYRICCHLATSGEFVSWRKFLTGGHYMDLDWFFQDSYEPLDIDAAVGAIRNKEMLITITNVDTGCAEYVRPDTENWLSYAKASSAIPVLYRQFVQIDGRSYCDGGVADPLPVQEAYRRGARRIVVLRTQPLSCRTAQGTVALTLAPQLFRRYPALKQALHHHFEAYFSALRWIDSPPADCQIVQIAPSAPMMTTRTKGNQQTMAHDYQLGMLYGELTLQEL